MTWIRLDDNFPDHPKVLTLSDEAFRLYISGLCYSSRYLTDGVLLEAVTERLLIARTSESLSKSREELVNAGLWLSHEKGWEIAGYHEYQSTKEQVEQAKLANRERVARWREKQGVNGISNALVMPPHTPIHTHTHTDIKTSFAGVPRVHSAREATERITNKLSEARANGINAWNLSKLVEDEWDTLHSNNDIGGCIALTVWYVTELITRRLTTAEISRIGQMTKRFGRIALLAIDEASAKDLDDLVSYAFRVAQNMYKEGKLA